jgi:transposase
VPQSHRPGDEAEVDFGEVVVRLAGEEVKCFLFCLRLSFSGKAVHRVSLSGGQEAFFEGHEHAFRVLGGVPAGKIRYDNLKAAVAQVIGLSRSRVEADRWTAFRSHWAVDAFYCRPGIDGAHEKGGVEGQIGWFRRNHLVPVPEVPSIQALNAMIDDWDAGDEARRIGGGPGPSGSSSRSSVRCCARCRRSRSRRACGSPRGSTASPRSWCVTTATRCRCG